VTAVLASVELLPLSLAILHHPRGSTPLASTPPGDSFMRQPSSWNGSGGTVGSDGQSIDLPGPTVVQTRSAPPYPSTSHSMIPSPGGSRK